MTRAYVEAEDLRERIVEAARERFFSMGVSQVTMEELAHDLGMSKKTVYKFFNSKDDLVKAVLDDVKEEVERNICRITENNEMDFVQKLKTTMTFLALHYSKWSPALVQDLRRNAPHVWKEIEAYRSQKMEGCGNEIRQGIELGVFRADVDPQLVMRLFSHAIQTMVHPDMLSQIPYSAGQVYETIVKIIYGGMFTDEARRKFFESETPSKEPHT
jgi:AcrR family transcriptional regulator